MSDRDKIIEAVARAISPDTCCENLEECIYYITDGRCDCTKAANAAILATLKAIEERLQTMWRETPNERTKSTLTSFQQNAIGPGVSACLDELRSLTNSLGDGEPMTEATSQKEEGK